MKNQVYTVILRDGHKEKKFTKTFKDSKQRVQWIVNTKKRWKEVICLEGKSKEVDSERRSRLRKSSGYDLRLESDIVAKKKAIVSATAIYALIDKDRVVYVGQSRSILARLHTHITDPLKKFTHYAIIEWIEGAPLEFVDKREAEYIAALKPKYNVVKNPCR